MKKSILVFLTVLILALFLTSCEQFYTEKDNNTEAADNQTENAYTSPEESREGPSSEPSPETETDIPETSGDARSEPEQTDPVETFSHIPTIISPDTFRIYAVEPENAKNLELLPKAQSIDDAGEYYNVWIDGDFDLSVPGTYDLRYVSYYRNGERLEKPLKVIVISLSEAPFNSDGTLADGIYKTENGHELKVENGIAYADGYLIANKSYPLTSDYNPGGIIEEAMNAYWLMRGSAPADLGSRMYIASGYRSYIDQRIVFGEFAAKDGVEVAETYSARPGHSEHQSGLAMDIVCASTVLAPQPYYKEPLDWLNENAWKYGFILRYPEGKSGETGYIFEPWHFRYVGTELAQILYNNGDWITMEEYFGLDSAYKY